MSHPFLPRRLADLRLSRLRRVALIMHIMSTHVAPTPTSSPSGMSPATRQVISVTEHVILRFSAFRGRCCVTGHVTEKTETRVVTNFRALILAATNGGDPPPSSLEFPRLRPPRCHLRRQGAGFRTAEIGCCRPCWFVGSTSVSAELLAGQSLAHETTRRLRATQRVCGSSTNAAHVAAPVRTARLPQNVMRNRYAAGSRSVEMRTRGVSWCEIGMTPD